MSSIHQLKHRISTTKNIAKITKAMEMVAASKMKKAQNQAIASRPYSQALSNSLQILSEKTNSSLHPLLSKHQIGLDVGVIISTDKGLCGSLNTNLFKNTIKWAKKYPNSVFIAIGKKSITFIKRHGFKLYAQFSDMPDKISISDLLPISSIIIECFLNKQFKSVHLIYTDFINTLSQQSAVAQLLPLSEPDRHDKSTITVSQFEPIYLFEPNPKAILEELLPYYIENSIFQSLLEAKASEHSARMVAMKNASENALDLMDELKLIFNKTRQENITNELLDITTATLTQN